MESSTTKARLKNWSKKSYDFMVNEVNYSEWLKYLYNHGISSLLKWWEIPSSDWNSRRNWLTQPQQLVFLHQCGTTCSMTIHELWFQFGKNGSSWSATCQTLPMTGADSMNSNPWVHRKHQIARFTDAMTAWWAIAKHRCHRITFSPPTQKKKTPQSWNFVNHQYYHWLTINHHINIYLPSSWTTTPRWD